MRLLTIVMVVACALAGNASAQSLDQSSPVKQWVKTPSANLDPDSWPERALRLEKGGNVVLKCTHNEKGVLSACVVLEQSPRDLPFGAAALRMSRVFKLKPTLSDGSPLQPGEITFPVPFRIEEMQF